MCLISCILLGQTKSTTTQTIDGKKFYIHSIEKKQSLYSIAKLYSVSLDDIYKYNPEAKSSVKTGQELKIPYALSTAVVTPTVATTVSNISFAGIDTTKFIQDKNDWIKFCKENNVKSLTDYNNLCKLNELLLPANPADFYKEFSNIIKELEINKNRR